MVLSVRLNKIVDHGLVINQLLKSKENCIGQFCSKSIYMQFFIIGTERLYN